MASSNAASSGKKNKAQAKTLGSLLRHFEGMELIVELKTGRMYRGTLSSADEYMNMTLDDVEDARQGRTVDSSHRGSTNDDDGTHSPVTETTNHSSHKNDYSSSSTAAATTTPKPTHHLPILSSLHIKGPKIRYVHFPENFDLSALIRRGLDRERAAANMYNRGKRK